MKLVLTCVAGVFLLLLALVAFPLGTPASVDQVAKAWADPSRQDVSPAAVEASLEMQSAMVLGVFLAVPVLCVALAAGAMGGRRR